MKITANGGFKLCHYTLFSRFPELIAFTSTRHSSTLLTEPCFDVEFDKQDHIFRSEKQWYRSLNIPEEKIARIIQAHGDDILYVTQPGLQGEGDALVTDQKDLFLRVVSADCLPVFIFDPVTRSVGLVHAGWRGLEKEIVAKTIRKMATLFNVRPRELFVAIGPFIHACCYTVKEDVAAKFPFFTVQSKDDANYVLDLGSAASAQLAAMEIPYSHVEMSPWCTSCSGDLFYSARRDNPKTGRNISVIAVNNQRCSQDPVEKE